MGQSRDGSPLERASFSNASRRGLRSGSNGQKYLHTLRTRLVTDSGNIGKPPKILQAASLFEDEFHLLFSEAAAVGDCVSRSCKCRVMLGFEDGAVMRHLVRYEEFAAWLEKGGEDGRDGVHVCKVVVGLRALGRER